MATTFTRRDLLRLAGGSILGILFTPVPWKLLDDASIWTQNWSLTPKLPRGPITIGHTTCTLCPSACGVRVRSVAGIPTSLSGVANHPLSRGVLCPAGLGGHHIAYHPLRVSECSAFSGKSPDATLEPAALEKILASMDAAIAARKENERIAILDLRPGRLISGVYEEFAALVPGGVLIENPNRESAWLDRLADRLGVPRGEFGLDLENARVILSLGAPLLDGWGTFGRMHSLARRGGKGPTIIQAEPSRSESARNANLWLPIAPGTESALALGIAHLLLAENLLPAKARALASDLDAFRERVAEFTPGRVAALTGLQPAQIEETARMLATGTPSVVISGSDAAGGDADPLVSEAAASLNLLLGSVGCTGGIVRRRTSQAHRTPPDSIGSIPDGSIRLLIVDGAESGSTFPWGLISPKLAGNAFVVSFSPVLSGVAVHADAIIPSPAPYEGAVDVPTPWDAPARTFAVGTQHLPSRPGTIDPRSIIHRLAGSAHLRLESPAESGEALRRASALLHEEKRGSLFSPEGEKSVRVSEISSAEAFFSMLEAGGVWIDDPVPQKGPGKFSLATGLSPAERPEESDVARRLGQGLLLEVSGIKGEVHAGHGSPLMTKLYQESGLRDGAAVARVHPATAEARQMRDGEAVVVRTSRGSRKWTLRTDPTVHPRVVRVSAGPDPDEVFALCDIDQHQGWRYTPATLEKGE